MKNPQNASNLWCLILNSTMKITLMVMGDTMSLTKKAKFHDTHRCLKLYVLVFMHACMLYI